MFDLISIGDSVIDTFVPLTDAKIITQAGEPLLAMRYGDKIPVGPGISLVAGNACNNAVGSTRLSLKTAIYTHVGNKSDDGDDQRIIAKLKREKVDTRFVAQDPDLPSNHHIVLDFKGDRTILIYHQPWKYQLPDLDKTKWIYLTSLGPTFVESNLIADLVRFLERTGTKMLYNPGTFQIKLGVKKNAKLLSLTEVFIVNKEESKLILGYKESEKVDIKKLLKGLADLGPKQVVITDGGEGSFGFDGQNFFSLGIFPAHLVEMTGSGDAYATGVLAGLFHGEDLPGAMRWGAANGAAVVEDVGPQAGLLTFDKMQQRLKENSKIVAKEV